MELQINNVMAFCNAFWTALITAKDAESVSYAYRALVKSGAQRSALDVVLRSRLSDFQDNDELKQLTEEKIQ